MKTVTIGKSNVSLIGNFQLKYNGDIKRFRMTNINSFVPPGKSIEDKLFFKTQTGFVESLIISKTILSFKPDVLPDDLHNVNVLIQHRDVKIDGLTKEEHENLVKLGLKKSNPKFTLTNIDKVDDEAYDREVELIELKAILYSKKKPLSKEMLIFIASNFGIPYKNQFTNEERLIRFLQKRIDQKLQSDTTIRTKFSELIENIKLTEMVYYLNEFEEAGFVSYIGGIYKVKNIPIGANREKLVEYFESNPTEFNILKEEIIRINQGSVHSF